MREIKNDTKIETFVLRLMDLDPLMRFMYIFRHFSPLSFTNPLQQSCNR